MSSRAILALLADGEVHVLPKGEIEVLVACGLARWVEARTLYEGLENRRRGIRPVCITDAGRRRVPQEPCHG